MKDWLLSCDVHRAGFWFVSSLNQPTAARAPAAFIIHVATRGELLQCLLLLLQLNCIF